jgi:carbonic anhydrase
VQFHFHHPSEHRIGDKAFPMEAHFVHKGASDTLAAVGVLMTVGKPNPVFTSIIRAVPAAAGEPVKPGPNINPNGLLPVKRAYYRYSGSLTTPPCSETVDWMLFIDPIEVDETSVAAFAKLYPNNARPLQRLDRRFVLRSS